MENKNIEEILLREFSKRLPYGVKIEFGDDKNFKRYLV